MPLTCGKHYTFQKDKNFILSITFWYEKHYTLGCILKKQNRMIHNIRAWQPTATIETLKKRAQLLSAVHAFFAERNVMQVETPILGQGTVTDPCLESLYVSNSSATDTSGDTQTLYLQTSPEYHMKRLLAANSGPIYQICKAFRNEDYGRHHNPEFTMLEWYRPGWSAKQLMQEVDALLQTILHTKPAEYITYQRAMEKHLQIDPLNASDDELLPAAQKLSVALPQTTLTRDELLNFMFVFGVEPHIGQVRPCFITHFPASQASLAKLNPDDPKTSLRFELYYRKVELANGFEELTDMLEQLERFKQDNVKRAQQDLPEKPIDFALLAALEEGLPDCSGVALGLDRLLMLATNAASIAEVISFAHPRA